VIKITGSLNHVSNVSYCQLEGRQGEGAALANTLPLQHHVTVILK